MSKITIPKLIPKEVRCLTTFIDEVKYIGSEHFILREDLCSKALKERVEKQFFRELRKNAFKDAKEDNYSYKEVETETSKDSVRLIDGENYVYVKTTYYQYFKDLGYEFRFNTRLSYIALFKDDGWVGMVLPMRVVIDGEVI